MLLFARLLHWTEIASDEADAMRPRSIPGSVQPWLIRTPKHRHIRISRFRPKYRSILVFYPYMISIHIDFDHPRLSLIILEQWWNEQNPSFMATGTKEVWHATRRPTVPVGSRPTGASSLRAGVEVNKFGMRRVLEMVTKWYIISYMNHH